MDTEAEARKQGWVPQDEWRGDPEKWTDAETFVERGEKIAGIATKRAKELEQQLGELSQKVEQLQSANAEFGEFHRESIAKARAERDAALERLRKEQAEAISEGDGERFLRVQEKIDQQSRQQPAQEAWAKQWAQENQWYGTDKVLTAAADVIAQDMRATTSLQGKAFLDEMKKRLAEEMPHKFSNPNRGQSVTAGKSESVEEDASPKKRTFDALPADAKAQCDKWVKSGLFKIVPNT